MGWLFHWATKVRHDAFAVLASLRFLCRLSSRVKSSSTLKNARGEVMNFRCLACVWFAVAVMWAGNLSADAIHYEFTELLDGSNVADRRVPFDLGVTFEQIDDITFELQGTATSHTWEVWDDNRGFLRTERSESWVVKICKAEPSDRAHAGFSADGPFDEDLVLWTLGGDWDDLRSGTLELTIYPRGPVFLIPEIYTVLVSSPEMTLTKADLCFSGIVVPEPSTARLCILGLASLSALRRAARRRCPSHQPCRG